MTSRAVLIAGVALLITAGAVVGYVVGQGQAPTEADASFAHDQAFELAFSEQRRQGFEAGRDRGSKRGRSVGRSAGARDGEAAGSTQGASHAEARLARVAAVQAEAEAQAVQDEIAANVAESEAAFAACDHLVPGTVAYADCLLGTGVPTGVQPDDPVGVGCPPGYYPDPSGGDSCLPE